MKSMTENCGCLLSPSVIAVISIANRRTGFSIEEIFNLTKIDRWFLVQIKEILYF